MGWHLWVTQATGPAATVEALGAVGFVPTGEVTTLDGAISEADDGDTLVVVPTPDGLVVACRFYLDEDVGQALSVGGGRAVTGLWQSVTDSYVLTEHRDGALTRQVVRAADEVVVDEGTPLPEEAVAHEGFAEDRHFALFAAVTGVDLSRVGSEVEVPVLRRAAPPAPAPRRAPRGLFRRRRA